MSLLNYEINIFLIWFEKCVLVTRDYDGREPVFAITDTKLYVPVVTLSAQGNKKLFQQLKTSSKRTINWNTYQSKPTIEAQNWYLNHLIDPSFQEVNKLFILSF